MVARFSPPAAARPTPATDRAERTERSRLEAQHDATLVRRFNAGDETAFVEIVTRYRDKMFHVSFGLLRNRADAEEMAQDTFIRAHRSLAHFRGDSSLSAWLHCITLNLSRNRYWYFFRRGRHVSLPLDAALGSDGTATFAELVASDAPGPVREVVNLEFSAVVARCMEQLPPLQREILQLLNVEQHSYARIARLLNIRTGTVKSRVARARAGLRVLLGEAYPEFRAKAQANSCFESRRHPAPGRGELVCA